MAPAPSKPVPTDPMSFEQFLEWLDEDTHAEWVEGRVILKMPVSVKHLESSSILHAMLRAWIDYHQLGKVYTAPLQVKLTLPDGSQRSREPDLVVILHDRLAQLTEQYFDGVPNLIVEILSPSTRAVDRGAKFVEYEAAGVPEYWVIDPEREYAEFWQLDATGVYRAVFAGSARAYRSREVAGLWLQVEWLWSQPSLLEVLQAWGLR